MATLDSDVPMVPVGEASSSAGPSSTKKPKRFEIKKWNAVALWAWGNSLNPNLSFSKSIPPQISTACCMDLGFRILVILIHICWLVLLNFVDADIVVDNCAICRNHIMDLCEF